MDIDLITAREQIHAALLALPRTISYADVASVAGVSAATIYAFAQSPERARYDTVAQIGEAIRRIRYDSEQLRLL